MLSTRTSDLSVSPRIIEKREMIQKHGDFAHQTQPVILNLRQTIQ